jgi:hypothetical protein
MSKKSKPGSGKPFTTTTRQRHFEQHPSNMIAHFRAFPHGDISKLTREQLAILHADSAKTITNLQTIVKCRAMEAEELVKTAQATATTICHNAMAEERYSTSKRARNYEDQLSFLRQDNESIALDLAQAKTNLHNARSHISCLEAQNSNFIHNYQLSHGHFDSPHRCTQNIPHLLPDIRTHDSPDSPTFGTPSPLRDPNAPPSPPPLPYPSSPLSRVYSPNSPSCDDGKSSAEEEESNAPSSSS